jgi:hypothetical protein
MHLLELLKSETTKRGLLEPGAVICTLSMVFAKQGEDTE